MRVDAWVEIEKSRQCHALTATRAPSHRLRLCLAPVQDCGVWRARATQRFCCSASSHAIPTASANPPACTHDVDGAPEDQAAGTTR